MDIDNFKFINDALGHHAGDELIRSLSRQLKGRIRRTDIVARLGGDEFALLLTGTSAEDATRAREELLAMARGHRVLARDKPVQVTTSIGIAMLDAPNLTAEQLLTEADVAMYEAKGSGRDRAILFTRDAPSPNAQRAGLHLDGPDQARAPGRPLRRLRAAHRKPRTKETPTATSSSSA